MSTATPPRSDARVAETPVGDGTVPRLELADWAARFGVVAGVTARGSGFSLGLWSEESVGQVMGRWRAFRAAFAPRFPAVVLSHQVHGSLVQWHADVPPGWLVLDGHDGHGTADQGVLLTVTVADCVPVYLAIPGRAVALLHAGWRGVAGGVLARGVELLRSRAGVPASEIVMHCGVSICGACYEVGSEVIEKLSQGPATGPGHVDLRSVLCAQGRELGIGATTSSSWCTAHDHERFFSHRASNGRDGRMVAYLGMPLA